MTGAQLLIRCLEGEGVRYVFGIPGEETTSPPPRWTRATSRRSRSWPTSDCPVDYGENDRLIEP